MNVAAMSPPDRTDTAPRRGPLFPRRLAIRLCSVALLLDPDDRLRLRLLRDNTWRGMWGVGVHYWREAENVSSSIIVFKTKQ